MALAPISGPQARLTPERVTPERFTAERVTPQRFAPQRLTPERFTPQRFTPERTAFHPRAFHPQEAPQPGAHRERRSQEPTALPGCAPVDYATNEGGDSATCHKVNLIQLVSTPVRGVTG